MKRKGVKSKSILTKIEIDLYFCSIDVGKEGINDSISIRVEIFFMRRTKEAAMLNIRRKNEEDHE